MATALPAASRCSAPTVTRRSGSAALLHQRGRQPASAAGPGRSAAACNHARLPSRRAPWLLAPAQAAAGSAAVPPDPADAEASSSGAAPWQALAALAVATCAAVAYVVSTGQWSIIKEHVIDGPLGKSGFAAAFSLIFLSEIGDKTFFIAALLAMRLGRWLVFFGSLGALSVMTVISVGIGAVFRNVPDALRSSLPVGEVAGVLLLVYFGVRALREATKDEPSTGSDEELADAETTVQEAESAGKVRAAGNLASLFEVASLIFLAEWGDRSMLATIALGAAQSPVGVAVGATAGHAVATAIAVVGGALASKHVSEKMVNLASGLLFLVFAAATAYTLIL